MNFDVSQSYNSTSSEKKSQGSASRMVSAGEVRPRRQVFRVPATKKLSAIQNQHWALAFTFPDAIQKMIFPWGHLAVNEHG